MITRNLKVHEDILGFELKKCEKLQQKATFITEPNIKSYNKS